MTDGRWHRARRAAGRGLLALLAAAAAVLAGSGATQDAVANGDTRTLYLVHDHTKEEGAFTFKRNGSYDQEVLKQLNWLLRDWRLDEAIRMDPKLFDIVWQVYREVGGSEPIQVLSAYRSPQTNAMLRRRSRAVSEHSQHMMGKALDFRIPGVAMARAREVGMRLQDGGVGFYPGPQFVHLDAGSVRSWPRMPGSELARLFPDGRTVHIPREGRPLPGYEDAKAVILAKGGSVAGVAAYAEAEETGPRKSLWAMLFGGADEDEDGDYYRSPASRGRAAPASARGTQVAAAYAPSTSGEDAGSRGFFASAAPPPDADAARRARGSARTQVTVADPQPAIPTGAAPGFETQTAGFPFTAAPVLPPAGRPLPAPEVTNVETGPVPIPPRRPDEAAQLVAAPLPPVRPALGAPVGGAAPVLTAELRGEMAAPAAAPPPRRITLAAADDRSALKALFDSAATTAAPSRATEVATSRTRVQPVAVAALPLGREDVVSMSFTAGRSQGPDATAFSGPAVAPLPRR